jgi:hypothetical protein
MRSRLWVAACLALVLAPAGAFAQCGCDNPVCLNDCVGYGCMCDMPPPPDCTCGLPNCFGMGCACGVGLCACPGLGVQCMYCNSGCPPPDPRCTGAVACNGPNGCGNQQDCFCGTTYCENDGPMCCMGGQKIVCHEAGCQGDECAEPCGFGCTPMNHCTTQGCDGMNCACTKHCNDYCGQPPCGGRRVCANEQAPFGCGSGPDCTCDPTYCKRYTLRSGDKPYPCACWECSFLSCPCDTAGECNDTAHCVCRDCDFSSCPCPTAGACHSPTCVDPVATCATCDFAVCICQSPGDCGHPDTCACACTAFDSCPCPQVGACHGQECQ